jgi:hypothetical protein
LVAALPRWEYRRQIARFCPRNPTRRRDPSFRERVLKAYEYRCAVCGFDVRLKAVPVALDAAHIRSHQAGGPDVEGNGLALCVLHHKTFDLGAFTVSDGVVLISDWAYGTAGFQEWLMAYLAEECVTPSALNGGQSWTTSPGTAVRSSRVNPDTGINDHP